MSRLPLVASLLLAACVNSEVYVAEPCDAEDVGLWSCSEGLGHILECRESGYRESTETCPSGTICNTMVWPLNCEDPCVLDGTTNGPACWAGNVQAQCLRGVAESVEICENECQDGSCQ